MEQTVFNPPCIQLLLADKNIWKQFYPTTEMIVTKVRGRPVFPNLIYKVKGLDADSMYQMFVFLERVDDVKYKYDRGQWQEFAKGEPRFPIKVKEHPDGARKGDHWMKDVVSFAHLRITNNRENEDRRTIAVQSMHKFRPVVVVKQIGHDRGQEFRIPLTEFVVVTAYQSTEMTKLKIAHNKFASGFRTKKEKSSSTDNEATSQSSCSMTPVGAVPGTTIHPSWDQTMNFFNSIGLNPTGHPIPTPAPIQNTRHFSTYVGAPNNDLSYQNCHQNFLQATPNGYSMPLASHSFAPVPGQDQKQYTELSSCSDFSHGKKYKFEYPRNPDAASAANLSISASQQHQTNFSSFGQYPTNHLEHNNFHQNNLGSEVRHKPMASNLSTADTLTQQCGVPQPQSSSAGYDQPAPYPFTTVGQSSNQPGEFLGIAPVVSILDSQGPFQSASNWVGTTLHANNFIPTIPLEGNYHSLLEKGENPHYGSNNDGSSSNSQN